MNLLGKHKYVATASCCQRCFEAPDHPNHTDATDTLASVIIDEVEQHRLRDEPPFPWGAVFTVLLVMTLSVITIVAVWRGRWDIGTFCLVTLYGIIDFSAETRGKDDHG